MLKRSFGGLRLFFWDAELGWDEFEMFWVGQVLALLWMSRCATPLDGLRLLSACCGGTDVPRVEFGYG